MEKLTSPFSSRNRGAHSQIDNDFPESARIGLLHIIHSLVERQYMSGWEGIARELQRIARVPPPLNLSTAQARDACEKILSEMPWEKVFDFCERLYGHLAEEVWRWNSYTEEREVVATIIDVQGTIAKELNQLF